MNIWSDVSLRHEDPSQPPLLQPFLHFQLPASCSCQILDLLQTSFPSPGLCAKYCPWTASCSPVSTPRCVRTPSLLSPQEASSGSLRQGIVSPENVTVPYPRTGYRLAEGAGAHIQYPWMLRGKLSFPSQIKSKEHLTMAGLPHARDSNGLEEISRTPVRPVGTTISTPFHIEHGECPA